MTWRAGPIDSASGSPGVSACAPQDSRGLTLLELLVAVLLVIAVVGMAMPRFQRLLSTHEDRLAVRHLVAEATLARVRALRYGTSVGIRFEQDPSGYRFRTYLDGNGDGVRANDVRRGIDQPIGPARTLAETFPSARLSLDPSVPALGGMTTSGSRDAVRFGSGRTLTYSPLGTATPGTLYVHGGLHQYAIRSLGSTGRIRVMKYDWTVSAWIDE